MPGTVAMARTSDPQSATAQFFINVARQQVPQFSRSDAAGLRLHRVRKGDPGHGRREQDRRDADRRRRTVSPRTCRRSRVITQDRNRRPELGAAMVILHTNHGPITIELDAAHAPKIRRQLSRVRSRRALRQHGVPSRYRWIHDPGRRVHRRLQAEADPAADRERSEERAEEQALHRRDGAHVRSAFRPRRSSSSTSPTTLSRSPVARRQRLGLLRLRPRRCRLPMSSITSRACPPPAAASTRTCRPRMW